VDNQGGTAGMLTAMFVQQAAALQPAMIARDALMQRSVEQQLHAFKAVYAQPQQLYLSQQWTDFLDTSRKERPMMGAEGNLELTSFFGHLQRSPTAKIFIPKKSFRSLSPGNPYLQKAPEGTYEEVHPRSITLRLMRCREGVAVDWIDMMPALEGWLELGKKRERGAPEPAPSPTAAASEVSAFDRQLLLGMATRLATRAMVRELSLRPSCDKLCEWLKSYLLVEHAADLEANGSVDRLHDNLLDQPMCIRGGALVDPLSISLEIFERSSLILEVIEKDLEQAPQHVITFTSSYLEACLNTPTD